VDDSKKLTETQREELYAQIVATPGVAYAVCLPQSCSKTCDTVNFGVAFSCINMYLGGNSSKFTSLRECKISGGQVDDIISFTIRT